MKYSVNIGFNIITINGIRIINYLDINVHVYSYYSILCDYDKFIKASLDISDNIKFSLP